MKQQQFLTPITVGQLPQSIAFGGDANTLYVANSGSEYLSVVDLTKGAVTGKVRLPPIPFNASFALLTPSVIASSQRGPQVIMSNGTLWMVVGASVVPRTLNTDVFGTATSIPSPQTMASSPGRRLRPAAGGQRLRPISIAPPPTILWPRGR